MGTNKYNKRNARLQALWICVGCRFGGQSIVGMNERFRLMCIGDYISQHYEHNPAIIFIAPSDAGKSDTVEIFIEEHDTAAVLPPSSPTGMLDFFSERADLTTIILDDPSNWGSGDFFTAIQFLKSITKGKVEIPRRTKFQTIPAYLASMQTVLFANLEQYQLVRSTLKTTGYHQRAVTIFSDHNTKTRNYIFDAYKKVELPHFTNTEITQRETTNDEEGWIKNHFRGHKRKTVQFYAKTMTEKEFNDLKPFLLSEKGMQTVYEDVEFKELEKEK